jgi:hypothetical protein
MRRWQMSGNNETVLDAMQWEVVSILSISVDRAVGRAVCKAVYRAVGSLINRVVDRAVYNRVTYALDVEVGNV